MNNPSKDFLDAKERIGACPLRGEIKSGSKALRDALGSSTDHFKERKESYYYHAKSDSWFTKPLDSTTRFVGVVSKEELQELIQLSDTREIGGVSTSTIVAINSNEFLIFYDGIGDTTHLKTLSPPAGVYRFIKSFDYGIGIKSTTINTDKYVELYDEQIQEIQENIDVFMKSKDKYKDIDMLHKRGILLYGPPGNGKSMLIKHVIKNIKTKHVSLCLQVTCRCLKSVNSRKHLAICLRSLSLRKL